MSQRQGQGQDDQDNNSNDKNGEEVLETNYDYEEVLPGGQGVRGLRSAQAMPAGFEPPPARQEYEPLPATPPELQEDPVTHRRLRVTKTAFEPPAGMVAPPLVNDEHACVLLNFGHKGQRPRSEHPAFRLLGLYPDVASLREHAGSHHAGSDSSLHMMYTHRLTPICATTERQCNETYCKGLVEEIAQLHANQADRRERDFQKNVGDQKTGDVDKITKKEKEEKDKKIKEAGEEFILSVQQLQKTTGNMSATAMLARQNFAVIIILLDIRPKAIAGQIESEPLLAVLDVFSTLEDAENYAKYTAARHYTKCAIDIVDLYGWLFPSLVNPDEVKEVYGNQQLQSLMNGRKDNAAVAEKYIAHCKSLGIEPTYRDVDEKERPVAQTEEEFEKALGSMQFHPPSRDQDPDEHRQND